MLAAALAAHSATQVARVLRNSGACKRGNGYCRYECLHGCVPSFAARFHGLPATVAQLIFLAGKAIEHRAAPGAAVDTGTQFPSVVPASTTVA